MSIVGEGTDKSELVRKVQEYGLEDFVTFWGSLSNNKVRKMMQEHHLFLLPSFFEGFPIVLLESLSSGCVPVVTNLQGITDITIENNKNGFLVEKNNIEGFVNAISFVKNNPAKWLELSNEGISALKIKYSVEAMGQKYVTLIEQLFKENNARHRNKLSVPLDFSLLSLNPFPLKLRSLLTCWLKKIFEDD
jgi:glycosyltransferase involved in cell wall biosynthesis